MTYYLNKIVWFFLNPITVPLVGALVGAVLLWRGRMRKLGGFLLFAALGFLWFESTVTCVSLLGMPLESPYLGSQSVEALPNAQAIVVLGGGIGKSDRMKYPDLYEGADRAWHAARLWKQGKAPIIVVSGLNDLEATVPFLLELGVPRDRIVVDNESRNTYENSRFTERLIKGGTVLLVTSAWHMPRACGNFSKTSLQVVPAPCDFSTANAHYGVRHWWDWIVPSADSMARTSYLFKEWLGKFARK